MYLKGYATVGELMLGLSEYFTLYNAERPHQALQNKTPDEVYKTAAGGGALIVQEYKTKCEKSDEIAPAVDNCPAHRTSLWTVGAMPRYGSCQPLPELEPTA